MERDPNKIKFESVGLPKIDQWKPPELDSSFLQNIRPLEKIESTLDEISKDLKEQNKLLSEILKRLETK